MVAARATRRGTRGAHRQEARSGKKGGKKASSSLLPQGWNLINVSGNWLERGVSLREATQIFSISLKGTLFFAEVKSAQVKCLFYFFFAFQQRQDNTCIFNTSILILFFLKCRIFNWYLLIWFDLIFERVAAHTDHRRHHGRLQNARRIPLSNAMKSPPRSNSSDSQMLSVLLAQQSNLKITDMSEFKDSRRAKEQERNSPQN